MRKLLFIFLLLSNQVFGGNILTINGYVPDYEIKLGDRVVSIDLKTGERKVNTVMEIRTMDKKWYSLQNEDYIYYTINRQFTFFSGQSIYDNSRVVHVSDVEIGDTLYDQYGGNMIVNEIGISHPNHKWFRFIISGDHSYIEDGILVHNASRFWVGGGSSTNFGATANTNWASSSGGANNQSVPGSSDDATFDGAGSGNGACVVAANVTVLSLTFTTGYTNTITINSGVTLTIAGNFTDRTQHSWTVSGTGALSISAASTITSNGKTFPGPVTFTGANTKTLSGNWTISGTLSCTAGTVTINKTASEVLSCAGWTVSTTTVGTINVTLTGGTWSGTSANTVSGTISIAGNVTVSGTVNVSGCTLTYSSGTVTTTNSTLQVGGSTTFNTNGITWATITLNAAMTATINSLLTCNILNFPGNAAVIFAGTSGFTTNTLSQTSTGVGAVTLVNTVTYTINTAFNCFNSRTGAICSFTSDHATNKAILTLQNGATCNVLASFTRIDASAGRTIWTFNGTVTSCNNINTFNDLKTVSKSFVQ